MSEHQSKRSCGDLPRKTLARKFSVDRSTEEYFAEHGDPQYTGAFGHIRKRLDYDYHSNYRKERQWFHDGIIENFLMGEVCELPQHPWLILSCGAYGAGKHFTVHSLIESGRLPLLSFVHVDPDEIRRTLPEYSFFCDSAPEKVDMMTQKECGYMAETLTLAALQAGRNVILDGCLQDANWYRDYVKRLRTEFKGLKVGIIHVTADPKTVLRRASERATETERKIPEPVIKKALSGIPESVSIVAQEVDEVFRIRNEDVLELEHRTWSDFSATFTQQVAGSMPYKRRPSTPAQMEASAAMLRRESSRRRFSVLQSTEENNRCDNCEFYGKFAHIRETLDYDYHSNYTLERQGYQDSIISEYLEAAVIKDRNGEVSL